MNRWFLILVPVIVVSFIRLRPIDLFIRSLNTLIHEFSHAFVALCLGEKVKEIKLNDDFSGSCTTKSKSKFKAFLVSLSGYTMCAVVSYLLIRFMNDEYNKYVFYFFIFLCIFTLILYIRNMFGILWVTGFLVVNLIIVFIPYFSKIYPHILYIYANIIMIENFLSTLTLLHLNILSNKKAGDSYLLQKATHIPALFYTLFFVTISCFFIYKSFILVFNH